MLSNPRLWERLEDECRKLRFGELTVVVKVQDGLPHGYDVVAEKRMVRETPVKRKPDEII